MSIPITEVAIIIERQNGGCAYCNTELNLGDCIVEEATKTSIKKQDIKIDSDDSILIEEELKTWRTGKVRQISKRNGGKKLPAYIVLKNEEIKDIARLMPDDEKAFKEIYGLGDKKWEEYGEEIIAIVKKFSTGELDSDDIDNEDDLEKSLQAICPSCDTSKKQAIRIPQGQMKRIEELNLKNAEVIRLAVAEFLKNLDPEPTNNGSIPSNLEKHLVVRERDGVTVKIIYM